MDTRQPTAIKIYMRVSMYGLSLGPGLGLGLGQRLSMSLGLSLSLGLGGISDVTS